MGLSLKGQESGAWPSEQGYLETQFVEDGSLKEANFQETHMAPVGNWSLRLSSGFLDHLETFFPH